MDSASTQSRFYSTAEPLPHVRPYSSRLAEKAPLLEVFRMACVEHLASGSREPLVAAECGIYQGSAMIACMNIARDLRVPVRFYGFDTFEGLPELSDTDCAMAPPTARYLTEKRFADAPYDRVRSAIIEAGHGAGAILVRGLLGDTLPTLPPELFSFVNIDCDLYSSTKTIFDLLGPQIIPGTVIVFDEYIGYKSWKNDEFKAFQEAVTQYQWKYQILTFSFATKQVAVKII